MRYKDVGNDSNVREYQFLRDGIQVTFKDDKTYVYREPVHVRKMKRLAVAGDGLNGYINTNEPAFTRGAARRKRLRRSRNV